MPRSCDDRGRPVRLRRHDVQSSPPAPLYWRASRASSGLIGGLLILSLLGGMLGTVVVQLIRPLLFAGSIDGLTVLVVLTIPVLVPVAVLAARLAAARAERREVEASRAMSRCPACEYDLAGLTPEPDGCTVCPECGAAWSVPASADAVGDPSTPATTPS